MDKLKTWITWKNLANALFFAICIALILSPAAKVFVIRILMYAGLMSPPINNTAPAHAPPASSEILLKASKDSLVSTAQLKGKVVIINFWASWCPPCRAEMPSLNELYKHYQNDPRVIILPVDVDGKPAQAENFMKDNQYQLPVYELAGQLPGQFNFESIPTTIVLDSRYRLAAKHSGAANYTDPRFYNFIDQLVKAAK